MNKFDKLKSISKKPLNVMVYETLLEKIVDGTIKHGTKLNEVHIAKQLEVSATPVREALKKLAAEDFIEIKPYCGAIVKKIDYNQIMEAYIVREKLEILMVNLIIEKEDLNLSELYDLIKNCDKTDSIENYVNTSNEFHKKLRKMANNSVLELFLEQIEKIIIRDRNISANSLERKSEIISEHKKILDAIKDRNNSEAEKAVKMHIKNGMKYIDNQKSEL